MFFQNEITQIVTQRANRRSSQDVSWPVETDKNPRDAHQADNSSEKQTPFPAQEEINN